jgi:hypothetical protein
MNPPHTSTSEFLCIICYMTLPLALNVKLMKISELDGLWKELSVTQHSTCHLYSWRPWLDSVCPLTAPRCILILYTHTCLGLQRWHQGQKHEYISIIIISSTTTTTTTTTSSSSSSSSSSSCDGGGGGSCCLEMETARLICKTHCTWTVVIGSFHNWNINQCAFVTGYVNGAFWLCLYAVGMS